MRQVLFSIFISILFFSCKKDNFSTAEKIITSNLWEIDSYADVNTGFGFTNDSKIYYFKKNGELEVSFQNTKYYSTWELKDNDNYIEIGSNLFLIQSISRKMIGLRYGTIEIFYTAIDKE